MDVSHGVYKAYQLGPQADPFLARSAAPPREPEALKDGKTEKVREKFQEFADFNRMPYRIVYPVTRSIYQKYGVSVPPLTYLIDRKGNVVGRFVADPGREKLEKVIELFL